MTNDNGTPAGLTRRLSIRLTASEHASLQAQADSAGMVLSDFVRARLVDSKKPAVRTALKRAAEPPQFRALAPGHFSEISRIGNNLNQIARALHSGPEIPWGLDPLKLATEAWSILLEDEVTARYATVAEGKARTRLAPR